jgi:hypothetical protein
MDQLLQAGKIPAHPRPCCGGLTAHEILIDGGSDFNLLFVSTLKKMGLDISKMLTPSKATFYGIVPGNAATLVSGPTSHLWDERQLQH